MAHGEVAVPSALTSPALLSPRERRENGKTATMFFPLSPSGREGSGE